MDVISAGPILQHNIEVHSFWPLGTGKVTRGCYSPLVELFLGPANQLQLFPVGCVIQLHRPSDFQKLLLLRLTDGPVCKHALSEKNGQVNVGKMDNMLWDTQAMMTNAALT